MPADPAGVDDLDAARVLADMWDGEMPTGEPGDEDDAEWQAMRAPFPRQFPGLAPPGDRLLTGPELDAFSLRCRRRGSGWSRRPGPRMCCR